MAKLPTRPASCNNVPTGSVNVYRISDQQKFRFNCAYNQASNWAYKPAECASQVPGAAPILKYNFMPAYATTYVYNCGTNIQTATAPMECNTRPTSVVYTYNRLAPPNLQYTKYDCRTHVGPIPVKASSGLVIGIIIGICICLCICGAIGAKARGSSDEEVHEEVVEEEVIE